MRAKFIQLPVELLTDPRVSALELRLYGILLRYGLEGRGFSSAGHRLLASNCHCHPKTIARCLKNLQSIGWITIKRVGLNKCDEIRCRKTVQRPKPEGAKPSYQVKTPQLHSSIRDKRNKRYRRGRNGLADVQETPTGKPQSSATRPNPAENRETSKQFKDAQATLTTALEENIRPASLYWFKNAIVTGDTADELTISVGNDQVQLVQEQYSSLLGRLMDKKVILNR